jgi:hypothetical protein
VVDREVKIVAEIEQLQRGAAINTLVPIPVGPAAKW